MRENVETQNKIKRKMRKGEEVKHDERRWQTLCGLTWQMRTPVSLAGADVRSGKRSSAFCWDPTGSRWHLLKGTHTQQNEALACYYCYLCGMWARAWMLAVTAWALKITKQSRRNNKAISKHWHSEACHYNTGFLKWEHLKMSLKSAKRWQQCLIITTCMSVLRTLLPAGVSMRFTASVVPD